MNVFMQRCFDYFPINISNPTIEIVRYPEMWKPLNIIGIKYNTYNISTKGRIYSIPKQRLLNPQCNSDGYMKIKLLTNIESREEFSLHRLVLMTFFPIFYMNELEVNHINGKKDDNDIANLEWCSRSQNIHHSYLLGSRSQIGVNNGNAKFNENDVRRICEYRQQGLVASQICKAMDLDCEPNKRHRRVENILFGVTWKHISSQYGI